MSASVQRTRGTFQLADTSRYRLRPALTYPAQFFVVMVCADGAADASDATNASNASPANKMPSATPATSTKLGATLLLALALAILEKGRLVTIFFSSFLLRVRREGTLVCTTFSVQRL